ncbi:hypothetical protein [Candidatus Ruminimicrobiellum ovillum]|uniref:hypothetical protein n=1 Tax=Candidatus Ruminimicrobiellum ovillum TaxID=1947927 RepID=UPI00355A61C1
MKKFVSILLTLCFCANISFAFDPYADEEIEKKSYKKLYYGIALTLLGGFLAYDGFSLEKVDVSKPSVDYLTVSHSEWIQNPGGDFSYQLRSGISLNNDTGVTYFTKDDQDKITKITDYSIYEIKKVEADETSRYDPKDYDQYTVEQNILYNNGNVDLKNLTIEVRYKFDDGYIAIDKNGTVRHIDKNGRYSYEDEQGDIHYDYVENQGYHIAGINYKEDFIVDVKYDSSVPSNEKPVTMKDMKDEGYDDPRIKTYTYTDENSKLTELKKGDSITWQDIWEYSTIQTDAPAGKQRSAHFYDEGDETSYNDGTTGLNLGKDSTVLMEVRVKLEKNKQYTPIYETRHKSDLEGVAGIFVGVAGIYFIIDHFFDMRKFNAYAKRHSLNLRVATASNQYKLMLQKRI